MRCFAGLTIVAVVGMTSVGCGGGGKPGPKLYTVPGTVTFNGEPLQDGDLVIRTKDGKHAAGSKIKDGKFQVKTVAGQSVIEITALKDVPGVAPREENPGEKVPVREQIIPRKYNAESELTTEIKADTKDLKFELKS